MKAICYIDLGITVVSGLRGTAEVTITKDGDQWAAMHLGRDDTVASCVREIIETIVIFESFYL